MKIRACSSVHHDDKATPRPLKKNTEIDLKERDNTEIVSILLPLLFFSFFLSFNFKTSERLTFI